MVNHKGEIISKEYILKNRCSKYEFINFNNMENFSLNEIRLKKEVANKSEDLIFEISTIELKENDWGKFDLLISKVKVSDKNGKFIKFAKINKELLIALKEKGIITIKNNK
jgi:hypothetical protein